MSEGQPNSQLTKGWREEQSESEFSTRAETPALCSSYNKNLSHPMTATACFVLFCFYLLPNSQLGYRLEELGLSLLFL